MNLSDKNKHNLLQNALTKEYKIEKESPIPKKLSIEEVFDDHVIYNVDGQLYKATYEMEEDNVVFGDPEKVLSTKIYRAMEALSMENKRALLDTALRANLGLSNDDHLWVEDMTDAEVFYNHDHQPYKVNYTLAEDGAVTFGEPVKVVRQVVFKPIESLQKIYSEIIQEAGRRNASLDSSRIRKILSLCQELLSGEGIDEKAVKMEAAMDLKIDHHRFFCAVTLKLAASTGGLKPSSILLFIALPCLLLKSLQAKPRFHGKPN